MGAYTSPEHDQTGSVCVLAAVTGESVPWVSHAERLAHDVCNYLTAISGMAQVARLLKTAEDKDAYLCRIEAEVQGMAVMLRDVLVDRTSDPREELVPGAMRQLLFDAATLFGPKFEQRGVTLKLKCTKTLPTLRLAVLAFKQVLVNLLDNALHFTPPGGTVLLSATASRTPAGAVIRVQDTGSGIPKKILAKVWQPGYTTRADGFGLGLPMAREIVDVLHGGRITIRSGPGLGTTVRIFLPR